MKRRRGLDLAGCATSDELAALFDVAFSAWDPSAPDRRGRRETPRIETEDAKLLFVLSYAHDGDTVEVGQPAAIADISADGFGITFAQPVPTGAALCFAFTGAGGEPCYGIALVARTARIGGAFRVGLAFPEKAEQIDIDHDPSDLLTDDDHSMPPWWHFLLDRLRGGLLAGDRAFRAYPQPAGAALGDADSAPSNPTPCRDGHKRGARAIRLAWGFGAAGLRRGRRLAGGVLKPCARQAHRLGIAVLAGGRALIQGAGRAADPRGGAQSVEAPAWLQCVDRAREACDTALRVIRRRDTRVRHLEKMVLGKRAELVVRAKLFRYTATLIVDGQVVVNRSGRLRDRLRNLVSHAAMPALVHLEGGGFAAWAAITPHAVTECGLDVAFSIKQELISRLRPDVTDQPRAEAAARTL